MGALRKLTLKITVWQQETKTNKNKQESTRTKTSSNMLKLVLLLVIVTTVVQANQINKEYNRHSELLKPESNAIDHGPSNYKSAHRLLGHRGEHGNISHGKNKKKLKRKLIKNKNKKKATHSLNGAHHDSLDDMRLQDLSYSPMDQRGMKKIKKDHHKKAESHHSEKYMKKLKMWKAKMMSKNKPSFKNHHGNKGMP